ncbi:MAG: hypothetical protein ACLS8R_08325 [Anaeromassilibacillus sp.]
MEQTTIKIISGYCPYLQAGAFDPRYIHADPHRGRKFSSSSCKYAQECGRLEHCPLRREAMMEED